MKVQLPKVANFTDVCIVGHKLAPIPPPPLPLHTHTQTSVNIHNFEEQCLRSLKTYHFQIWQYY